MKKPTQRQKVINYMKKYGSITTLDAIFDLGITRLAAVEHDLKKDGYPIRSELVTMKTQYGSKTVSRYSFDSGEEGEKR